MSRKTMFLKIADILVIKILPIKIKKYLKNFNLYVYTYLYIFHI